MGEYILILRLLYSVAPHEDEDEDVENEDEDEDEAEDDEYTEERG